MTNFLPDDYNVPSGPSRYMKLDQGANRFRALASPILGYEAWLEGAGENGKDKPVRFHMNEKPTDVSKYRRRQVKHFWAFPVWNYQDKAVQVLQITQSTIQKAVRNLTQDEDWGSPLDYDVVITKEGEKLETVYSVQPKPHKPIEGDIEAEWQKVQNDGFDINRLFDGGDPFSPDNSDRNVEDEYEQVAGFDEETID